MGTVTQGCGIQATEVRIVNTECMRTATGDPVGDRGAGELGRMRALADDQPANSRDGEPANV